MFHHPYDVKDSICIAPFCTQIRLHCCSAHSGYKEKMQTIELYITFYALYAAAFSPPVLGFFSNIMSFFK